MKRFTLLLLVVMMGLLSSSFVLNDYDAVDSGIEFKVDWVHYVITEIGCNSFVGDVTARCYSPNNIGFGNWVWLFISPNNLLDAIWIYDGWQIGDTPRLEIMYTSHPYLLVSGHIVWQISNSYITYQNTEQVRCYYGRWSMINPIAVP